MKYLLLILGLALLSQAGRANVKKNYNQYCANCHGDRGQGGMAESFLDQKWEYGNSDEQIAHIIREGIPDMGMEAYKDVLNAKETRSMVIYIQELVAKANQLPSPASTEGIFRTEHQNFRIETLLENPKRMWGLSFLPDDRILITEFEGAVRILESDGTLLPPIEGIPDSLRRGQGGMLDVAVHPDYEQNGWIYLSFAEGSKEKSMTTIVRGKLIANRWVDQEIIYRAEESFRSGKGVHFGSRIVFKDGYVFFSIGERGHQDQAQDLNRPNGKIHRLHDDGSIPKDNPFVGSSNQPSIWTYGNRNPQALAFRPGTHELWSTEHGPRGGDELNLLKPGLNYGWPKVTFGMNYNGTPITEHTSLPDMEPPVWHWTPSIAVCGMAFVNGAIYPGWKGDILAGGLKSQVIERLRVGETGIEEREVLLKDQGRVRDIKTGNDGYLYVILDGDGSKVIRLLP